MYFKNVLGNDLTKNMLLKEVSTGQVPHAQLFEECGGISSLPMALAFAMYLFCENKQSKDSCGVCKNCIKMLKLSHPDLHFFFPTIGYTKESGSKASFVNFKKFIQQNAYISTAGWMTQNNMKTSGEIKNSDVVEINRISNLKSYEGQYKVFIIWTPENLNNVASNKLLKTLEEPTPKTIFILVSEKPSLIIKTITSRLQHKQIQNINTPTLLDYLEKKFPEIQKKTLNKLIQKYDNNYNEILLEISGIIDDVKLEKTFIKWIRLCFLSNSKNNILDLINCCEDLSSFDKASQLYFTKTASEIFRSTFLIHYNLASSCARKFNDSDFNLINFSKYVNNKNIMSISKLLDDCYFALNNRTAVNSKILFLDLSFSLGSCLHDN